ncbi:MAG: STAS domain-containing protein [Colwellia sp.]|nr:STAS domain-containing protein [Colwellia sp.]
MQQIEFVQKGDKVTFSGALTLATINRSFEKSSYNLLNTGQLTLDLSNILKVDTACLAWLLAMMEQSVKKNCQLTIDNLPNDLIKLAKLSSVDLFLSKN